VARKHQAASLGRAKGVAEAWYLAAGDTESLKAISEFGAKPYTEDEEKELSEIVKALNERHGTEFSEDDFIRYEPACRATLYSDLPEVLSNNAPDVAYSAFAHAHFQKDGTLQDILLKDSDARDKLTRSQFNRAFGQMRDQPSA